MNALAWRADERPPGVESSPQDQHGIGKAAPRSSSEKVLGVIDLFTEDAPEWTIEQISRAMQLARTTAYRHVKTLTDAGLLAPIDAGRYVLGPRIIQLDRQIRLGDPLLRVAPALMAAIRNQVAGVQLLCSYYGEQVICIHDDRGDRHILSSYDRGRPFPLLRGGPSRVILAHLSNRELRSQMLNHASEIAEAGLGNNWKEFNRAMRQIRQAGYFAGRGEIHPENFGVSAPILHRNGAAGCLCLARSMDRLKVSDIPLLIELALETAAKISAGIQNGG